MRLSKSRGAAEIELLGIVGIRYVDRFTGYRGSGRYHFVVGLRVVVEQSHWWQGDELATGATHVDTQRFRQHDLKRQLVIFGAGIEGTAVGVGHLFGALQNQLHQTRSVLLGGEGDTDCGKLPD